MKRVFLSHSWPSDDLIDAMQHYLSTGGFQVTDASQFPEGRDLAASTITAIRQADVVVAVLHDNHAAVLYELGIATGAGKPVVVVGDPERMPAALTSVRFVRRSHDARANAIEALRVVRTVTEEASDRSHGATITPEQIESMSVVDFEALVGGQFERLGFVAARPKNHRDSYDFLLSSADSPATWVVEAKKLGRQSLVSVMHVRQLVDVGDAMGAAGGILVASSGFTPSAVALASDAGVPLALITLGQLMGFDSKANIEAMLSR